MVQPELPSAVRAVVPLALQTQKKRRQSKCHASEAASFMRQGSYSLCVHALVFTNEPWEVQLELPLVALVVVPLVLDSQSSREKRKNTREQASRADMVQRMQAPVHILSSDEPSVVRVVEPLAAQGVALAVEPAAVLAVVRVAERGAVRGAAPMAHFQAAVQQGHRPEAEQLAHSWPVQLARPPRSTQPRRAQP